MYEASIPGLLNRIGPDLAIGLSVQGKPVRLEDLAVQLAGAKNPAVLVGGFPKGHFTPETTKALDLLLRVDSNPMDAHVVVARLVYEVEKAVTESTIKRGFLLSAVQGGRRPDHPMRTNWSRT